MRFFRILFALFLLVGFFGTFVSLVHADFASDYQGYLKTYDAYRQSHATYDSARNQYYQFRTLTAENDALTALKNLIGARDDVVLSYISLIRLKNSDPNQTPTLDLYTSFYQNHKEQISPVSTLEDALKLSQDAEIQIPAVQVLSQKITAFIITARIEALKARFIDLEQEAASMTAALRQQNKEVATLDRWLIDARNKRTLAENKVLLAQTLLQQIGQNTGGSVGVSFNTVQSTLFEANQYIREGIAYMHELAEAIKYGNY